MFPILLSNTHVDSYGLLAGIYTISWRSNILYTTILRYWYNHKHFNSTIIHILSRIHCSWSNILLYWNANRENLFVCTLTTQTASLLLAVETIMEKLLSFVAYISMCGCSIHMEFVLNNDTNSQKSINEFAPVASDKTSFRLNINFANAHDYFHVKLFIYHIQLWLNF